MILMQRKSCTVVVAIAFFVAFQFAFLYPCRADGITPELSVAIAPYQDLAMIVNVPALGLDKRFNFKINLLTMAWEDILPAIASAGSTADIGFGSLVEYLTKYEKLNPKGSDPVVFIQPLYIYNGGGFVTLSSDIKAFTPSELKNSSDLKRLTTYKIGAQKQSLYDMMIYSIAKQAGYTPEDLHVINMPMNDGLLALETRSLDITAAGLTQLTEANKRGGHLVISMADAGFADVVGFICRKSVLDAKRQQILDLIKTWFLAVDYVYTDIDTNSRFSLDYLRKNAATKYTFEEYKRALSQEFLPKNIQELKEYVLEPGSKYDIGRICNSINSYLQENHIVSRAAPVPVPVLY